MGYAAKAIAVEKALLKAGEGATCTVNVMVGETGRVPQRTPITGIPVVDVGMQGVTIDGGAFGTRRVLLLGAVKLNAAGADPRQADRIVIGSRTYAPDRAAAVDGVKPNPLGAAVLFKVAVLG